MAAARELVKMERMPAGNATNMNRFRVWALGAAVAAVSSAALADGKGDAAKGKAVFQEQCGICHHADRLDKKLGPGLKDLFRRDKLTNGKKTTEANVRGKVDDGSAGMPAFKDMLSESEKADLVAYLKTL